MFRLRSTQRKANFFGRDLKNKKKNSFPSLLEVKVVLTTRKKIMKAPEVRTSRRSNLSSLSTISSVNMNQKAYGKTVAFKKVKQKCFFLCGWTGRARKERIYLSTCTKPRKTRREREINLSTGCIYAAHIM